MTFRFADPWLFLLVPVAALAAWSLARRRSSADARLLLPGGSARILMLRSPWQHLDRGLPLLRLAVLLLLVSAAARPQAGSKLETVTSHGVDVVVALDVSGSMRAEDFPGNRLAEARRAVERFIDGRPSDRIGLVVFATRALTRCPLTLDHPLLQELLRQVDFAPKGLDETALGMGLATAVNRLRKSDARSKVVVLLTDGRNNRGAVAPETAADAARTLGVKVYPIGVGTDGRVPIPGAAGRVPRLQLDLDEPLLQRIAAATGGRYFRATDAASLGEILAEIDGLERTEVASRVRVLHEELFHRALVPGLLLLGLERLLLATRLKRIP
jgi:Ca-activated chloride channel family protein